MAKIGPKKYAQQKETVVNQQKREGAQTRGAADPIQNRHQVTIAESPYIAVQRKRQEACFGASNLAPVQRSENKTGIPDRLKAGMEERHGANFSDVRVHAESAKAPEVGALAYTQGSNIHFAPGQFSPDTAKGKSLLGHELTHVVQQRQGRVQPTTEVAGMPVNDNPKLEQEADAFGKKVSDL